MSREQRAVVSDVAIFDVAHVLGHDLAEHVPSGRGRALHQNVIELRNAVNFKLCILFNNPSPVPPKRLDIVGDVSKRRFNVIATAVE